MSTAAVTTDPYAAYGGKVASGGGADPYAAYGGKVAQPVAPVDTRNAVQKSFDANTQTSPNEPLIETGLKSVVHAIGAPFVHPEQTIAGMVATVPHLSPNDPENPFSQMVGATVHDYQEAGGGAHGAAYAGTKLAGSTFGNVALGEAGGSAFGIAKDAAAALPETTASAIARVRTAGNKLVPSLVDGPPESLITRAVKPGKNNINWNKDVGTALPLMKSAEKQLGRPITGVDDALEAAQVAKKGIWQQYQARLQSAGQMGATVDGNAIADAMVKSIDKRTALQNPGLVEKVKSIADTYRHPIPLDDAEDFLQSANKDLHTYYTKNKVGQQVAMNDPEISSTVAEANALRSALYSKLDQVAGPGAAQLKQAYGSLTNMEKELYGRQLVAARQAPESLSEQLSTARGAGKIAKGVLTASPGDVLEGAQNIAVSRALKARNSTDAMIARAFQKSGTAQPFPAPTSARISGLLERGPIQMPAPQPGTSIPSAPAISIDATTRAQRLGLLLPEKAGGKIPLPYYPEMSVGERAAALMQQMRRAQAKALPEKASSIRLSDGK